MGCLLYVRNFLVIFELIARIILGMLNFWAIKKLRNVVEKWQYGGKYMSKSFTIVCKIRSLSLSFSSTLFNFIQFSIFQDPCLILSL